MRFLKNKKLIASVLALRGDRRRGPVAEDRSRWPSSSGERGPMQVTVDEDGETRVRDRFVVSSPVSGRLQRIELEPGDQVVREDSCSPASTPARVAAIPSATRGELGAAVEAGPRQWARRAPSGTRRRLTLDTGEDQRCRQPTELMKAGAISSDDSEAAETRCTRPRMVRPPNSAERRAEGELRLAAARLGGRARRTTVTWSHRSRASSSSGCGRANRRTSRRPARRDRRPGPHGDRGGPAVDGCGSCPAGRPGAHRAVGRQSTAARPRPAG